MTISQPTQLKKFLSYVEFACANAEHLGVSLEGISDDVRRLFGIELAEGHVYVDVETGDIWCEDMVVTGSAKPIEKMYLDMFKKPVRFHDFNDSVPGFSSDTDLAELVESGRFKWVAVSGLVTLKYPVETLQANEEDETVFTYLSDDMPQCPYCSGRVEAPFTDQTIPWRGECSRGHSLLYQLDEEGEFESLEADLIAEFSVFLAEVECGNLMDFDPDWVLESFMKEYFGSTENPDSYKDDEKAMLFYNDLGLKWCSVFADKQEKVLMKPTLWAHHP